MVNVIEATHADTGDVIPLYGGQEVERNVRGKTQVQSVYLNDTGENLISDLTAYEEATLTWLASANRLASLDAYSDDRRTARAEYAQQIHRLVPPSQGGGWEFSDTSRGEKINGYFENIRWQVNEAEPYVISCNAEFKRGDGIETAEADIPSAGPANPTDTATLDGVDLGAFVSWSEKVKTTVKGYDLVFEGPDQRTLRETEGITREITLRGKATDTFADIEAVIDANKGQDVTVPYQSAFPGEEVDVVIKDWRGTRRQEHEQMGEYDLTLVEGET